MPAEYLMQELAKYASLRLQDNFQQGASMAPWSHNTGNSLHPVISQIHTATYTLAKELIEILLPYIPKEYRMSSAEGFTELLKAQAHAENYIIASLDVESCH